MKLDKGVGKVAEENFDNRVERNAEKVLKGAVGEVVKVIAENIAR